MVFVCKHRHRLDQTVNDAVEYILTLCHVGAHQTGTGCQEIHHAPSNFYAPAAFAYTLARPNSYSQPQRKTFRNAAITCTLSPRWKEKGTRF